MIGVVGPEAAADRLAAAIDADDVRTGDAPSVVDAGPDVVVGIGDGGVSALARAGVEAPVVPVSADDALEGVAPDRAPGVIEHGLAAGFSTRERPVLEVAIDGDPIARGLFDVMLVTSDPARISEFTVRTPGGADRYRADGVVVATPAGSAGYARAVGGPVLDPAASSVAVVPVAAFTRRPTVRVADVGATLDLQVERDEGDVSLLVDGEDAADVPPGRPVTVRRAATVETVIDPPE